jgi:hypothetical protein
MRDKYFVDATILIYAHDIAAGAEHDRTIVGRADGTPLVALVLAADRRPCRLVRSWGGRLGPQTIDGNRRALKAAANIP